MSILPKTIAEAVPEDSITQVNPIIKNGITDEDIIIDNSIEEIVNDGQTAKFEHSIQAVDIGQISRGPSELTTHSHTSKPTHEEVSVEQEIDFNVEKILKILCKVLMSEVVTDIAQSKPITEGNEDTTKIE